MGRAPPHGFCLFAPPAPRRGHGSMHDVAILFLDLKNPPSLLPAALYMSYQARIVEQSTQFLIIPLGIFLGGVTMLMVSFFEVLRRNVLGFTAFGIYGAFWLTVGGYGLGQAQGLFFLPNPHGQQALVSLMGIVSFFFMFLSAAICVALPVTFLFLTVMFFMLAAGLVNERVAKAAGWWGLVTAAVALYMGLAFMFEDLWGREILPIFYTKLYKAHAGRLFPRISHDDPYSVTAGVPYADRREIRRGDNLTALSAPSLEDMNALRRNNKQDSSNTSEEV